MALTNKEIVALFVWISIVGCTSSCVRIQKDHKFYTNYVACELKNVTSPEYLSHSSEFIGLVVGSSKWADIPNEIWSRLPNLKILSLSGVGLKDINPTSLSAATGIIELDLSGGEFPRLFRNMFAKMKALQDLDLSNGVIDTIDEGAFLGLDNLTALDLSHNKIKFVNEKLFEGIGTLDTLSLSFNKIQIFPQEILDSNLVFPRLANLDMSHNELEHIFINDKLVNLNASVNKIKTVSCSERISLLGLNLTNNFISSLECINNSINLTYLNLGYNNIGELSPGSFVHLTNLLELNLKNSNISNVVQGLFSHQEKLQILDLSYNQLGNFPPHIFLECSNITTLLIDGNALTEVEFVKTWFWKLQNLGLGDNNFNCSYLGETIGQLMRHNVTYFASNKTTRSSNIKGIGCTESFGMSRSDMVKVELDLTIVALLFGLLYVTSPGNFHFC